MKRFLSSERWILALVAIAIVITTTSTAEARPRLLRRLFNRPAAQTAAAPAQALRCNSRSCAPQGSPLGAYTPLPAVVYEPADLPPALSPQP